MKKYNKIRTFDGNNCDLALQITYVGLNKKKKNQKNIRIELCDKIVVDDFLILDNCIEFYNKRIQNYKQVISDFTHFSINEYIETNYCTPLIIKKNDDYILCSVKVDCLKDFVFVKFNMIMLPNDMCIHDYIGDIISYIENIISASNGYDFYINNKKRKFSNLKESFDYYLNEIGINNIIYSDDHIVFLSNKNYLPISKYIGYNFLKFDNCNNLYNDAWDSTFLSRYGNFTFIMKSNENFVSEYNSFIPLIENSYDIIKEYILLNKYFFNKYKTYNAALQKDNQLKEDYKQILLFYEIRTGLVNESNKSVSVIVKEYERINVSCFFKLYNRIKRNIEKEISNRKLSIKYFLSDTIAKSCGEMTEKILDKYS